MKTIKFTILLCTVCLVFTSCNDPKMDAAKQNVEDYTSYVDSISSLELAQANSNWENIEKAYNNNKATAKANIKDMKASADLSNEIDEATQKFEDFKIELAENKRQDIQKQKNNFRMSLLGENYLDDDMKFTWINKDNILSVYQNFVDTVVTNKDTYSREDWDEIKLLYEAIDTRKNTVENEGLTGTDNRSIAALKLKFAPIYSLNRMGAKSEENAKAKQ